MALRALPAIIVPTQPPGLPHPHPHSSCPQPRTPCQHSKAISHCPIDAVAGLVFISPQPCLVWPWALPRQAHLQAQVPAQPQPVPVPTELPDAWDWSCPCVPQLPCSWLGRWDRPWLPSPAITHLAVASGSCWLPQCPNRYLRQRLYT